MENILEMVEAGRKFAERELRKKVLTRYFIKVPYETSPGRVDWSSYFKEKESYGTNEEGTREFPKEKEELARILLDEGILTYENVDGAINFFDEKIKFYVREIDTGQLAFTNLEEAKRYREASPKPDAKIFQITHLT